MIKFKPVMTNLSALFSRLVEFYTLGSFAWRTEITWFSTSKTAEIKIPGSGQASLAWVF